ncbi:hypothetical protein ACI65C_007827 [Semiaphis heraclei]
MNCFQHSAVVVFVIACHVVHGIQDNHDEFFNNIQSNPKSSKIEFTKVVESHTWRRKRGFFSSFQIPAPIIEFIYDDDDKNGAEDTTVTSDAEVTTTATSGLTATAANVNAAYKSFLDAFQSSKETHIVAIGPDVDKSLVEAAPYLPLVNKLTTYIMPDLSLRDVVTLSLNVAVLTTQGAADNANAQVIGDQNKSDVRNMVGQYATGIYDKVKNAFNSHFGHIKNYFSDGEKIDSSEETPETHSIFDQVKKKMNIFSSFMNRDDEPQTENKENQIDTIVTQTYVEGSQTPIAKTIVTKTYESGMESIRQATNDVKDVISNNKLLENRNYKIDKIITEMKNELISDENSENESDFETYDDDNGDGNIDDVEENMIDGDGIMNDNIKNINDDDGDDDDNDDDDDDNDDDDDDDDDDDNVEIKEDDFNKVMQESMALQLDFVNTLDGEELLKRVEDLQKSLPNPNPNNRKTFKAVTEELDIDERYSDDHVNKLINVLEIITNYFIVKAIETNRNGLLTTTSSTSIASPTPPTPPMG